jgi:hypothetical protein
MRPVSAASRWAGAVAVLALLGACALTPQASPEADAAAKQFGGHPDAAMIYVYRSPFNELDANTILYLDGRVIGQTRAGTYFRLAAVPGRHVLHGTGIDLGDFELDARRGRIYVVEHEVIGGQSRFRVVPQEIGQQRVRACCALLETAWPGERPYVR